MYFREIVVVVVGKREGENKIENTGQRIIQFFLFLLFIGAGATVVKEER